MLDLYVSELQSDAINAAVPGPIGHLFHNRGATAPGIFEDVTAKSGVALDGVIGPQGGTFPFTARFSDFDGDGWPDLFITSDFRETRLFWSDGTGRFADGTDAAPAPANGRGAVAATSTATDSRPFSRRLRERVCERTSDPPRNDGNRFTNVTDAAGVRAWGLGRRRSTDNDGDVGLVVTNGANDEGFRNYTRAGPGARPLVRS
jgi:hypothetical protein